MDKPKSISDIPPPFASIFKQFKNFNEMQSKVLHAVLDSDRSIALYAPTGSGKTVILELAIVKMLMNHQNFSKENISDDLLPKAVYIAPTQSLCDEKFNDWQNRFSTIGVTCSIITGDSSTAVDVSRIYGTQIIVATPEKWDSLTRRWREYKTILKSIKLFMIDEVHLLKDEQRGPILEVIVARIRTINVIESLRFVAVSAIMSNIEDLTKWLERSHPINNNSYVHQYKLSGDQYSVPLEKHIVGYQSNLKDFRFDIHLNYKLSGIIRKYSNRKPTLIFCNSRKSREIAANNLERHIGNIYPLSTEKRNHLQQIALQLYDSKLANLVQSGLAYHHAGLSHEDRHLIETNFRNGYIMILLSTNTLAMGVNLPAHLVVIKSTEHYVRGRFTEYDISTLQQMMGRAGRPQYDTKGVAVIMTRTDLVEKYENLLKDMQFVESNLHKSLIEHLTLEIALNTIINLESAMDWLRSTFFYVRAMRNPHNFGIVSQPNNVKLIEGKLQAICLAHINTLYGIGLINRSLNNDIAITPFGRLMPKYYMSLETMKSFSQIQGAENLIEILKFIVKCKEFNEFVLRVDEKKLLNQLNETHIRYQIATKIKTREDKILCLIQASFGNIQLPSPSLTMETTKILQIGTRIANCLLDYLRLSQNSLNNNNNCYDSGNINMGRFGGNMGCITVGYYSVLLNAITIVKCFHANLWEYSMYASKQLQLIDNTCAQLLVDAGKTTIKALTNTSPSAIEQIVERGYGFGEQVLVNVFSFPEYIMYMHFDDHLKVLKIQVCEVSKYYKESSAPNESNTILIIGDSNNRLLYFDNKLESSFNNYGFYYKILPINDTTVDEIYGHVMHKSLVGVDDSSSVSVKNNYDNDFMSKLLRPLDTNQVGDQSPLKSIIRKRNYEDISTSIDDSDHNSVFKSKATHSNCKKKTATPNLTGNVPLNLYEFLYKKNKLQRSVVSNNLNRKYNNASHTIVRDTMPGMENENKNRWSDISYSNSESSDESTDTASDSVTCSSDTEGSESFIEKMITESFDNTSEPIDQTAKPIVENFIAQINDISNHIATEVKSIGENTVRCIKQEFMSNDDNDISECSERELFNLVIKFLHNENEEKTFTNFQKFYENFKKNKSNGNATNLFDKNDDDSEPEFIEISSSEEDVSDFKMDNPMNNATNNVDNQKDDSLELYLNGKTSLESNDKNKSQLNTIPYRLQLNTYLTENEYSFTFNNMRGTHNEIIDKPSHYISDFDKIENASMDNFIQSVKPKPKEDTSSYLNEYILRSISPINDLDATKPHYSTSSSNKQYKMKIDSVKPKYNPYRLQLHSNKNNDTIRVVKDSDKKDREVSDFQFDLSGYILERTTSIPMDAANPFKELSCDEMLNNLINQNVMSEILTNKMNTQGEPSSQLPKEFKYDLMSYDEFVLFCREVLNEYHSDHDSIEDDSN